MSLAFFFIVSGMQIVCMGVTAVWLHYVNRIIANLQKQIDAMNEAQGEALRFTFDLPRLSAEQRAHQNQRIREMYERSVRKRGEPS